ncbi:hypothetical protein ACLHDG_00180 [Sulfurovum sp. CS9]|uniref:hypothetical protein n=1 Tax=Sulfurovum sp. CS9 TaxID=3391146 RepID=UPI0039E7C84A
MKSITNCHNKIEDTPIVFYVVFGEGEDVTVVNDPDRKTITWSEYQSVKTDQVIEVV